MWSNRSTKQVDGSVMINSIFKASNANISDVKFLKSPSNRMLTHFPQFNGLDDLSDSEEEPFYLCWPCGRFFKFKCLFFKHQLFCVQFTKRKRKLKAWKQKRALDKRVKRRISQDGVSESSVSNEPTEFTYCYTCSKSFFTAKEYNAHFQLGQCSGKVYTCSECNAIFNSLNDFKLHMRRCKLQYSLPSKKSVGESKLQKPPKCRCCNTTFRSPELLKAHLNEDQICETVHHMRIKAECRKRNRISGEPAARKSFSNAVRDHKQQKYHHEITPDLSDWSRESSMSPPPVSGSARKSFHNKFRGQSREYNCRYCAKTLPSSTHLQSHEKQHFSVVNSVKPIHKCPECREKFFDSRQLLQHQADFDHYGKAVKSMSTTCACPYCDKRFLYVQTRNAHLRYHKDRTLSEIKEFVNSTTCDLCFRHFGTEVLKEQHLRIAHSDFNDNSSRRHLGELHSKPSKYVGSTTKSQVLDEVPEFVTEQLKKIPNVCPICNKSFGTSFARNRHFRSHVLDGAYECEFCHLKFPQADHLATHVQSVHREFLKYKCKECGARFSSRLKVLQHVTKMHAEMPDDNPMEEFSIPSFTFEDDYSGSSHADQGRTGDDSIDENSKEQFFCEMCKLSFLKLCGLRRHQMSKLHTQMLESQKRAKEKIRDMQLQLPPRAITPPVVDYGRVFTCSVCTQEFTDVHNFIPHRLSHFSSGSNELMSNEVDPYICEVCGRLMDNYQKIQLHLFWHLQDVQLQKRKNREEFKAKKSMTSFNSSKPPTTTIIPAELAGQTVAKKSFKSSSKQEMVIDGIKKPLFTCKDCSISFPSKHHYTIHMRQYCRARNRVSPNSLVDTNINEKESLNCSKCDKSFDNQRTVFAHERICEVKAKRRYCSMCSCIFSSLPLYKEHKTSFCSQEFSAFIDDSVVSQNVEFLKSRMKMDSNVVGCVQCKVIFSSVYKLSLHVKSHKTLRKNAVMKTTNISLEDMDPESSQSKEDIQSPNVNERILNELVFDEEDSVIDLELPKITNGGTISDDFFSIDSQENFYPSSNEEENFFNEDENTSEDNKELSNLRRNFSQLLCALVSDTALMDSLGFGERMIDDVLISVLEKMSLTPIRDDDSLTKLDKFRSNIRTLLNVCIKDQIMDFIADQETTTDEIVIAALKMFGVESESSPSTNF